MKRVILLGLGLLLPVGTLAADEALLFPDVTPATTTEFGFSKMLEQELLVKLEGLGFMLLNGEVLNESARDGMMICAEVATCPHSVLKTVPARVALVVRVEKVGRMYQVDGLLYQRDIFEPIATMQSVVALSKIGLVAQEVAAFANDAVGVLDDPNTALRSMAYQLIQSAGSGERVWVNADVGPCSGVYGADEILEHLDQGEDFLRFSDREGAYRVARQMEEGLLCYKDILTGSQARQLYARIYRVIGAGLMMGGQEQQATTWMVAAVQLDPQFEYGLEDMAIDHPVWGMFRTLRALPSGMPVEYVGTILGPGQHYLDGRSIDVPVAHDGQKHIYQRVVDDEVTTWVIDGSRFPPEAVEFLGLVETEKIKHSSKKERKLATDDDIESFRGVRMIVTEPKVFAVKGHGQIRIGLGMGAIDRGANLRNAMGGEQWFQEGPVGATRPRFDLYVSLSVDTRFEFGVLGGLQMSQHDIDAVVSGSVPGKYDVSAASSKMKVHGYLQPRVQLNLGERVFKPYFFTGFDVRFVEQSALLTDSIAFSDVPAAVLPGIVGGLGARFGITETIALLVESNWTGHFGMRAGAVQQGDTPFDTPNPTNTLRQTLGLVGGFDVAF